MPKLWVKDKKDKERLLVSITMNGIMFNYCYRTDGPTMEQLTCKAVLEQSEKLGIFATPAFQLKKFLQNSFGGYCFVILCKSKVTLN